MRRDTRNAAAQSQPTLRARLAWKPTSEDISCKDLPRREISRVQTFVLNNPKTIGKSSEVKIYDYLCC